VALLAPIGSNHSTDLRTLIAAIAVVAAQSALIAALLIQRARLRRAEAAQRATESKNAAILRAMPDMMFVCARDGTYLEYFSRDLAALYVPPEQFLGKTIREVMPAQLSDRFMRALQEACNSGGPVVVEYKLPIHGIVRVFEARMVADEYDRGIIVVRDTTVHEINTEMLRRREADLRASYEQNRDLAGRLIASQEAERERLARDLHDDLSQKLAYLSIELDQLKNHLASRSDPLASRANDAAGRAGEIAADVHALSHHLHPSRLRVLGLVPAIDGVCREIGVQHGIDVDFTHDRVPETVPPAIALCLYRILQEGLHNVAKHSGARRAAVRLSREDGLLNLQIADQGVGFDADAIQAHGSGLGLVSMRERVHYLGGRMVIRSSIGIGTRVGVRVPWTEPSGTTIPTDQTVKSV